jgi:hypothetical protein
MKGIRCTQCTPVLCAITGTRHCKTQEMAPSESMESLDTQSIPASVHSTTHSGVQEKNNSIQIENFL